MNPYRKVSLYDDPKRRSGIFSGPQWVPVYRGLANVQRGEINKTNLGVHWTSSLPIANDFANFGVAAEDTHDEDEVPPTPKPHGAVLSAYVHEKDILPWEEANRLDRGVLAPTEINYENEVTIRPNAPVHLQRVLYLDQGGNPSKTFNAKRPWRSKA